MTAALLATVLTASLVGSVHCIVMCGPLVSLAAGRHSLRFAIAHALGRLGTYVALGSAAGLVGHAVNIAGRLGAVQHAASLLAALAIIAWGMHTVAVARGWWTPRARVTSTAFATGLVQVRRRTPTVRAYLAGLLTGLIPCGWLWAFVVSAAGTGSALAGATVMAVFWLGTVPAMTGALVLVGPLVARIRARLPLATTLALVVLALGTLAMRWNDAGVAGVRHPSCHHVQETP